MPAEVWTAIAVGVLLAAVAVSWAARGIREAETLADPIEGAGSAQRFLGTVGAREPAWFVVLLLSGAIVLLGRQGAHSLPVAASVGLAAGYGLLCACAAGIAVTTVRARSAGSASRETTAKAVRVLFVSLTQCASLVIAAWLLDLWIGVGRAGS